MKTKISQYSRKKFFYRFFMQKSQRSGVMFGLAWIGMVSAVAPLGFFCLFSFFGVIKSIEMFLMTALLFILFAILFYLYGFITCAFGINRMLKCIIKTNWVRICIDVISLCFFPLLGIVLAVVMFHRKRLEGVVFALVGTVFFVLNQLNYCNYLNMPTAIVWGTVCCLVSAAFYDEKNKMSCRFIIPLGVMITSFLFLYGYEIKLHSDIKNIRKEISRAVGRSIELKDFLRRDAAGFPHDSELLKTLIASYPETAGEDYGFDDPKTAQKKLFAYQKKNKTFIKTVENFLRLPVSHFAHAETSDGMLPGMHMPELRVLREAARYFAMKIIANPTDKEVVSQCNDDLMKLRNISLQNSFYLSHLVAIAVEYIRFNALVKVLESGSFSKTDFERLVGPAVEWNKYLRYSFGDEATSFQTLFRSMKVYFDTEEYIAGMSFNDRYVPLFIRVHFLRDCRFGMKSYVKACSLSDDLSGFEKAEIIVSSADVGKHCFYIFSAMAFSSLGQGYKRDCQVLDFRNMLLHASEVAEYYRKRGKLPENLVFLSEIPLSTLDHKPFCYEKTTDGFLIFNRNLKGKKPEEEEKYSYLKIRIK